MAEHTFEPRLGRGASPGSNDAGSYVRRSLTSARSGPPNYYPRFTGRYIGRGNGTARLLTFGGNIAARRRTVTKTSVIRFGKNGIGPVFKHLRYLEREGVQRDGSAGRLYAADQTDLDGKSCANGWRDDRHHFRIIVSPEDGNEYDELKPLIRRFMAQMERDLGTRLEWMAVDHYNTEHPHSHILLRGSDEWGNGLVIAAEYNPPSASKA